MRNNTRWDRHCTLELLKATFRSRPANLRYRQIMWIVAGLMSMVLCSVYPTFAAPTEVWVKWGTGAGSGTTMADPKAVSTSAGFDSYLNGLPPDTTVHLLAGEFITTGFTVKKGQKIRGAGIDATIVRLESMGGSSLFRSCFWPDTTMLQHGAEVSDITFDCNLNGQTTAAVCGAGALWGSNTRISRVKAINWGTTDPAPNNAECFVLRQGYGDYNYHAISGQSVVVTNSIFEDVIITQPATLNPGVESGNGGVVGMDIVGAPPNTGQGYPQTGPSFGAVGPGWVQGAVIRHCQFINIQTASSGGKPKNFKACGAGHGTEGARIYDNYALNVRGPGSYVIYNEACFFRNYTIENNCFIDVTLGFYINSAWDNDTGTPPYNTAEGERDLSSYIRENLVIRGNFISLTDDQDAGGISVISTVPKVQNMIVEDNIVVGKPSTSVRYGVAVGSDVNKLAVNRNTIDVAAGGAQDIIWYAGTTMVSLKDNQKQDGSESSTYDYALPVDGELEIAFTPNVAGWYRLWQGYWLGSSRVYIDADNINGTATSTEFHFEVSGSGGTVNVIRHELHGGSAISKIRIANYDTDPTSGVVMQPELAIYVSQASTSTPIKVRFHEGWFNTKPSITYLSSLTGGAAFERIVDLGPGFRTSGALFSGSLNNQVTDEITGKVLSTSLSTVGIAQGGTAATDAPAARANLGLVIDQDVQRFDSDLSTIAALSAATPGKVILANGAAWTSTAISGDASLNGSGTLTVNKLSPGDYAIDGFNQQTLGSDLTLFVSSPRIQHLKTDLPGTLRAVTLPTTTSGREFIIHNIGLRQSNTNLVIKNASAVEQFQLRPGEFTFAVSKGTGDYEFQTFAKNQPFTISLAGVDAKVTTPRNLLQVPTGLTFIATKLVVESTAVAGTAGGAVHLGTTVTPNSIVNAGSLASALVNTCKYFDPKADAATVAAGSILAFKMSTVSGATTHTISVHVQGFYR
jgi:hypothetical protein